MPKSNHKRQTEEYRGEAGAMAYPTPEERQRMIARREELLEKLIHAMLTSSDAPSKIIDLVAKYSVDEVAIVMTKMTRPTRPFINDEVQIYREYRQAFASYGGDRRFLSQEEYGALSYEHGLLFAKRKFKSLFSRKISQRESELHDLLLIDALQWPDITPPDVPPRPADYVSPEPGAYSPPRGRIPRLGNRA